ncbi:MAG: UDP-N-acetylmuramoyl-L-alanyl-D-glutamate--2,6-diaminopimelate ligase [Candidatus Kapabacteria bacterium]|nr:UDP-N-acetylmuramoyl-L-alanyl-D-glutamate--2,6-diaminopimelate ligase [Candidatus Kapabacteria bacterium]
MLLEKLLRHFDYFRMYGEKEIEISGIQFDSRKIELGNLFVAVRGIGADGHQYISKAIEKGASAIVCEDLPSEISSKITYIIVRNSRKALAQLAHCWYDFPTKKMYICGITGTNGKTTCTFLIKSIFEDAGYKTGIIGTTGIFIGDKILTASHTTPDPFELCKIFSEMREEGISHVAMEVSSHSLDQYRVFGINFSAALFTNLSLDHLDYHENMINYANAKMKLFESLGENGLAIVNSDDEYSDQMLKAAMCYNKIKVGRTAGADYKIEDEVFSLTGSIFKLKNSSNKAVELYTQLPGNFNIENVALVAAFALSFGISTEQLQSSLNNAVGAPGRMSKYILKSGAIAFIDYAHTPDALGKALLTCKKLLKSAHFNTNKLICVFGCGGDRDKSKRPEMGEIAVNYADFTIITNDNSRTENPDDIVNDIIKNIKYGVIAYRDKYLIETDRRKAIGYAAGLAQKNDIILIAGKGHEDYQIIGTEKFKFDDYEEISKF